MRRAGKNPAPWLLSSIMQDMTVTLFALTIRVNTQHYSSSHTAEFTLSHIYRVTQSSTLNNPENDGISQIFLTITKCLIYSILQKESFGENSGNNLTNVQCKAIQNWHNESPLYNEYMLIKMKKDNQDKKEERFIFACSF
jgi:hypothetical protein